MYAATGGPNVKWGTPISKGGSGTTGPPIGDDPANNTIQAKIKTTSTQCFDTCSNQT